MSETESEGALRKNIDAVRTIVRTVKSTLGPMGRDKMMVDAGGNSITTNDGATILRELDVSHPGGKMIIECAQTQESLCYDGTSSTVVLAGELLSNSEALLNKGLHPNVVCKGYNDAARMAVEYLEGYVEDGGGNSMTRLAFGGIGTHEGGLYAESLSTEEDNNLKHIAKTAITGKTVDAALDEVSNLCVQAVKKAGSAEKVRTLSLQGGGLQDSYLFNGAIVNKDIVHEKEVDGKYNIVLLNTGLEPEKNEENVQVQMDMQGYTQFKSSSKDDLLEQAKLICTWLPTGGLIFIRDGAHDSVCAYLEKNEVSVVRRLPESTMRALSDTLGISIAQTPSDIECSASGSVMKQRHNDVNYLFVEGEVASTQSTLVLRGATTTTLDEIERGFDDALGVVSLVMNGDKVVAGGGSAYACMAALLRSKAAEVSGRPQMAIEAFADALECIPATIAENGGQDPLDCILALRNKIQNDEYYYGPDLNNGGVCDMVHNGVIEPASLVRQVVLGANEVTTAILKIDDMIAMRGE
tara:strand:+ start:1558 stop:3132 length:1575 start_codon:yes stop_codon:yes gene_type:complete